MVAIGFEKHVQGLMHRLGNTLDLIFTQLQSDVKVTNASTHGYISDHCMVSIDLHLHKLRYLKIEKTIRDKSRITLEALLTIFNPLTTDDNNSLDKACNQLNTELLNVLDKTVPLKLIKYSNKPRQPWSNKHIRDKEKIARSRQRAWNKYRQHHHWKTYTKEEHTQSTNGIS